MKRFLSIILCLTMVFGVMTAGREGVADLFDSFSLMVSAETHSVGDIIEFGSYPQSEVRDEKLIAELNKLITDDDMTNYNYDESYYDYNLGIFIFVDCDWMKYADITFKGDNYRAVVFTEYRCGRSFTEGMIDETGKKYGYQEENGYYTDTIYWFKYEPIKWRVLDPESGFIMSESLIDSQPFINVCYENYDDFHGFDFFDSYICNWLNNEFYNSAFDEEQKNLIQISNVNITIIPDGRYVEESESREKPYKIFLPSLQEISNTQYGFEGDTDGIDWWPESESRQAAGTDYAKCQGLYISPDTTEYSRAGYSSWHVRDYAGRSCYGRYEVESNGGIGATNVLFDTSTSIGVRPAMRVADLEKIILKNDTASSKLIIPSNTEVAYGASITLKAKATNVPEGYYVALYDGNTQLAKGSNTEVSYTFSDEFTSSKNITVKIIDDSENVQKGGDGNDLSASFEVKAKSGFFAKLIAFFKRLFRALPKVTVEPK